LAVGSHGPMMSQRSLGFRSQAARTLPVAATALPIAAFLWLDFSVVMHVFFRRSPSLVCTDSDADNAVAILDEVLTQVETAG